MEKLDIYKNFQLRKVPGNYWLLFMKQTGDKYKQPISLSSTGARIWTLLSEGKSQDEIVKCLENEYSVSSDIIKKDLSEFLISLHNLLDE